MTDFVTLPVELMQMGECVADYVYLPKIIHIDDPAQDAMLDFNETKPLIVTRDSPMTEARELMQAEDIHVVLVKNDDGEPVGLLSLEQILSEKPITAMEMRRVERKDMLVRTVMTPIDQVAGVNIESLKHAKVGHVVATLEKLSRYFIVVFQAEGEKKLVRGVFLASQISKLTREKVSINPERVSSLADMIQKLH